MIHPDTPTLADVADPLTCHFCAGRNLDWQGIWADCHDCTASFAYRRGQITATEPPQDDDAVSALLHDLRNEL